MTTKSNGAEVFKCCNCEREQLADIGEAAALAVGWTKHRHADDDADYYFCPFCSGDDE